MLTFFVSIQIDYMFGIKLKADYPSEEELDPSVVKYIQALEYQMRKDDLEEKLKDEKEELKCSLCCYVNAALNAITLAMCTYVLVQRKQNINVLTEYVKKKIPHSEKIVVS